MLAAGSQQSRLHVPPTSKGGFHPDIQRVVNKNALYAQSVGLGTPGALGTEWNQDRGPIPTKNPSLSQSSGRLCSSFRTPLQVSSTRRLRSARLPNFGFVSSRSRASRIFKAASHLRSISAIVCVGPSTSHRSMRLSHRMRHIKWAASVNIMRYSLDVPGSRFPPPSRMSASGAPRMSPS
jgi:hypothetical protein